MHTAYIRRQSWESGKMHVAGPPALYLSLKCPRNSATGELAGTEHFQMALMANNSGTARRAINVTSQQKTMVQVSSGTEGCAPQTLSGESPILKHLNAALSTGRESSPTYVQRDKNDCRCNDLKIGLNWKQNERPGGVYPDGPARNSTRRSLTSYCLMPIQTEEKQVFE